MKLSALPNPRQAFLQNGLLGAGNVSEADPKSVRRSQPAIPGTPACRWVLLVRVGVGAGVAGGLYLWHEVRLVQ